MNLCVHIYSSFDTPRLRYVLDFVFVQCLGIDVELHTQLLSKDVYHINYSSEVLANSIQLIPHTLLKEDTISEQYIDAKEWKGLFSFFKTSEEELSFDIFSASFYLISRYEEYLPYEPDEFKRFPHNSSLAFKHHFLNLPLVDLWLMEFKTILSHHYPDLMFKPKPFSFLPTYDIDIAYSYRGKGWWRNLAGLIRDSLNLRLDLVKERITVLMVNRQDPYDCYHQLDEWHHTYNLKPIYFLLLSKGGKLDKNISPNTSEMQSLIQRLRCNDDVGIHPSYQSNDDLQQLNTEIERLKPVTKSRQHYIRFALPITYRNLIERGITDDYSMGYGSINGFRAGTSHSFYWFDLIKNETTRLRIHPFCYMECNSRFEQKVSAETAFIEMNHYYTVVKKVNGQLITVWHNFSLGGDTGWTEWKEMYERFLLNVSLGKNI